MHRISIDFPPIHKAPEPPGLPSGAPPTRRWRGGAATAPAETPQRGRCRQRQGHRPTPRGARAALRRSPKWPDFHHLRHGVKPMAILTAIDHGDHPCRAILEVLHVKWIIRIQPWCSAVCWEVRCVSDVSFSDVCFGNRNQRDWQYLYDLSYVFLEMQHTFNYTCCNF